MIVLIHIEVKVELPNCIFFHKLPILIGKSKADLNHLELVAVFLDELVLVLVGLVNDTREFCILRE